MTRQFRGRQPQPHGCAPGIAKIDALEGDTDEGGLDVDTDADADADTDTDTDADTDTDTDTDETATLLGAWSLESWPEYPLEYTYRGERCTYVQRLAFELEFNEDGDGGYDGVMFLDYEVDAYGGEDCPYDGTYTGTQRTDAQADARGDARYEITVREWDLETTCTVDEDEMSCDVGMEWSRLN